jgi:hypothetical protein
MYENVTTEPHGGRMAAVNHLPLGYRLRLLVFFTSLVWIYNLMLSALGAGALLAVRAAGLIGEAQFRPGDSEVVAMPGLAVLADNGFRFWVFVATLIFATIGHLVAVLLVTTVHHAERELYRAGGWSLSGLVLASWAGSALLGLATLAVLRATGVA